MNDYMPYTYNRALQSYFVTGNTGDLDMPRSAVNLIADDPKLADHVNAVWAFNGWLKNASPELYGVLIQKRPELLDPASVVESGSLSPNKKSGLSGLSGDVGETITSWGQTLLDTVQEVAPSLLQLKTQNDLMKINIKRAEQGLQPIDSTSLAPTVNVGVSNGVQTFGYIALGGLVLVGLLSAFGKK